MKFLLVPAGCALAVVSTASPSWSGTATALRRSDPVLVRAVIDGDTIDVATVGRVRLLGIDAPEIGRGFDTAAPFARAARDRLAELILRRWVRLETEGEQRDAYGRRLAYVLREDGVCANTVLVREGLARVTARLPIARLDELKRAEAEARALRKGMWGEAPPEHSPGYTRRPSSPSRTSPKREKKRRSSWPRSPSSTPHNARFANATSSITGSTTGQSGSSSSSSRRAP